MFRHILNGGLQQYKISTSKILLYSTKVSPKNILSVESNKRINDENRKIKSASLEKNTAAVNNNLKIKETERRINSIIESNNYEVAKIVSKVIPLAPVNLTSNNDAKKDVINWELTPSNTSATKLIHQYLMLSKIRLTTLVVITSMVGYAMAPAAFEPTTFLFCTIGTGLCSAAANAINQYHEVPFDAQMSRTKNRVLVRGQLTPLHAINFAIASATLGTCLLYFGVNGYTAALGVANLILYTSIYTPMKRISILNTWIGSVVGAIPPIMGWVGCSGTFDAGSFLLAALLYTWQFPHFNALSWNLRPDYSRAGYRMMAVSHPALCRRTALRYTIALGVLCTAAPLIDVTHIWFALETLPLNAYFGYLAYKFYKKSDSGSSRKLFRFSLIQLPILMVLFFINKKKWISKKDDSSILPAILAPDPSIVLPTVKATM